MRYDGVGGVVDLGAHHRDVSGIGGIRRGRVPTTGDLRVRILLGVLSCILLGAARIILLALLPLVLDVVVGLVVVGDPQRVLGLAFQTVRRVVQAIVQGLSPVNLFLATLLLFIVGHGHLLCPSWVSIQRGS